MVAWALIGDEANLEDIMREGVIMALPGGSRADRESGP
jgi:hypothetical protein